jgi:crotonobetainyl-CoA:carnitine CoA-transferase CaiB-like acyl-CoA transferase|tara:strand:- start:51878 stop:53137 length:1260 start_codon:yes stop_codon:yes gene_type:complete
MTISSINQKKALSHIRICDFTGQLAGAGATRVLAAFGAEVIRIEDRLTEGSWDILRGQAPYVDDRVGNELGGAFNNHNIGKLGMSLNMRLPNAKEILTRLIKVSDVVTENFSAGVLDRWGFSYEEMKKIKPDIIYISNSGFGHSGPYSNFKTWGPIVQAVSGLTFQSGLPEMPPAGWGFSYMDHTGGYFMAIAILLAIYHKKITGEGQWVDMSCTDAGASLNGPVILDYTVNGRPLKREGSPNSNRSQHPIMSPHGIYKCQGEDNWIAISVRSDQEWHNLCSVMKNDEWLSNRSLDSKEGRVDSADQIDDVIESWTKGFNARELMDVLQAAGIPSAKVQTPPDRVDQDENTAAWELFPIAEHEEMGKVRVDGVPIKMSQTPPVIEKGAPLLGQHNKYVLEELLGYTSEEVKNFESEGVV